MRKTLISLALAASLAGICPAAAQDRRPFDIDDLLRRETIERVRASPDGRWIVVEHQGRLDRAPAYRYATLNGWLRSSLEVHDVADPVPPRRLFSPAGREGFVSGPFSPDGRRMAVMRLSETGFRLGVLTLETMAVEWLPVTPEWTPQGRTLAWRSDTELVLIARSLDDLPLHMRTGFKVQDRVTELWDVAASGRGSSGVFIRSGRDRETRDHLPPARLIAYDLVGRRERTLASGEWFDLAVSPDGRSVAALRDAEDLQPPLGRPVLVGDPVRRRRLVVADLETGRAIEPLPDQDFAMYLLAWSPDSRRLLAFARPAGAEDFEKTGRFWSITRGGAADPLSTGDLPAWIERTWDHIPVPIGAWDGAHPLVRVRQPDGRRAWLRLGGDHPRLFPVEEPGERIVQIGQRAATERSTGVHPLEAGVPALARGRLWSPGDASDQGASWNPDAAARGSWALVDGACLRGLSAPPAVCVAPLQEGEQIEAASAPGEYLVTRRLGEDGSTSVRLHTADGVRILSIANGDWAALDWGRIEPIPHVGPGGEPLTSWLLLPAGLPAGARPAVVVEAYPGPTLGRTPASILPGSGRLQNNPVVIANGGYAVLIANLPHPPQGRPTADDLAVRILAIVDEAGRRGLVDAERIALIGHSYGAYNVLKAATASPRFDAVIASNGYADLTRSMELHPFYRAAADEGVPIGQLAGWGESGQGGIGPFATHPQAYVDASPLFDVERLRAPTLLIESDLDNARMGTLFAALYRLNREAGLLTYYGEGHTFISPGNLRDLHGHILDWLERYLGPPDGLGAGEPVARPDFQDREQQRTVALRAPDEVLAR